MGGTTPPRYECEVAWSSNATGMFTIGTSTIGGGDTIGTSLLDADFGGLYDNVTAALARASITRGRDDTLTQMLAGEATVTLRDPEGFYSPENPASPLHAVMPDRLHPARLVMKRPLYPGFTPLFYGWTRRIVWQPSGRRGVTQLELVDLFYWLERAFPIIAPTGATTTGAAIALILSAAGVPASWQRLDVGDAIPNFAEADGSVSALELIAGLLNAERGVFYIAGSGTATYESRHARTLRTIPFQTIVDVMSNVEPSLDFSLVKNRVRVKRTQNNYLATATDQASVTRNGYSDLPEIDTPYLATDKDADSLAAWILRQVRQPRPPLRSLRIDDRTAALIDAMADAELVDRWAIQEGHASTDAEVFLERLTHTIDFQPRRKHTLDALTSKASGEQAFQIGVSTLAAIDYNLIPNPSFEINVIDGWASVDNGVPSLTPFRNDLVQGFVGESCLEFVESAAGADDYYEATITGLDASANYTISAYVNAYDFTAAANSNRGLYAYDPANQLGTQQTAALTAATSGYQRLSVTIATTSAPGKHTIVVRLYAPQGQTRWDAVKLEPGASATAYFDGSSPGATWAGTAHNSASQRITGGDVLVY